MSPNQPRKQSGPQPERPMPDFIEHEPGFLKKPEIKMFPEKEKQPEAHEATSTKEKAEMPLGRRQQPAQGAVSTVQAHKSDQLQEIEKVLQQDLDEMYFKLEPGLRRKFKEKGEQTAAKIEVLLTKTRVKVKEIFKLIFEWLKMLPGANKIFIKQEAKIKAKKIMEIRGRE